MHAHLRMLALNFEQNFRGNLIIVIRAHLNTARGATDCCKKFTFFPSLTHCNSADQF